MLYDLFTMRRQYLMKGNEMNVVTLTVLNTDNHQINNLNAVSTCVKEGKSFEVKINQVT